MAKAKTKEANATRGQIAKDAYEKQMQEVRSTTNELKAHYSNAKDDVVLQDILAKADKFMQYHHKVAQDGVGARPTGYKLADGTAEVENFYLTDSQIAGEMKKASGIQELVDYINRMCEPPKPIEKKVKKT